jgi:hypothetical protein
VSLVGEVLSRDAPARERTGKKRNDEFFFYRNKGLFECYMENIKPGIKPTRVGLVLKIGKVELDWISIWKRLCASGRRRERLMSERRVMLGARIQRAPSDSQGG